LSTHAIVMHHALELAVGMKGEVDRDNVEHTEYYHER
jgi:hypothetical protein